MALGIVSDDIFESELQKYETKGEVKIPSKMGRPEGQEHVPDSIRKVIGDTHIESGKQAAGQLAEMFGLSPRMAEVYSTGKTYFDGKPTATLGEHIKKTKERIATKAGGLALQALESITQDKLDASKAIELASIARAAGSIVKDMTESDSPNGQQVAVAQIVLHAPRMTSEDRYPVIDVTSSDEE